MLYLFIDHTCQSQKKKKKKKKKSTFAFLIFVIIRLYQEYQSIMVMYKIFN